MSQQLDHSALSKSAFDSRLSASRLYRRVVWVMITGNLLLHYLYLWLSPENSILIIRLWNLDLSAASDYNNIVDQTVFWQKFWASLFLFSSSVVFPPLFLVWGYIAALSVWRRRGHSVQAIAKTESDFEKFVILAALNERERLREYPIIYFNENFEIGLRVFSGAVFSIFFGIMFLTFFILGGVVFE